MAKLNVILRNADGKILPGKRVRIWNEDTSAYILDTNDDTLVDNNNGSYVSSTDVDPCTFSAYSGDVATLIDGYDKVTHGDEGGSGGSTDTDAIHDNVDGEIIAITEKTAPAGTDSLIINDSEASNAPKHILLSKLPVNGHAHSDVFHDNVAGEIAALPKKTIPADNDSVVINDSEDSEGLKKILLANMPVNAHEHNADDMTPDGTGVWNDHRINLFSIPSLRGATPEHVIIANDGSGGVGTAGSFDGSTTKGVISDYSGLDITTMSIALWINPDSVEDRELINRDMAGGFELYLDRRRLYFDIDGSNKIDTGRDSILAGATQLVVVTIEKAGTDSVIKMYINGVLEKESTVSTILATGTGGLIIGESKDGGRNYDGIMDDIQIYNIILTDAQIVEMYNDGAGDGTADSVPTGVNFTTDTVARFQNTASNTAPNWLLHDMTFTNGSLVSPGLVGVTTGSLGVVALSWPSDITTSVWFSAQLPHTYKEGTDISFHMHMMFPTGSTGKTRWVLEYMWVNVHAGVTTTTIKEATIEPSLTPGNHDLGIIGTIDGTGKTISSNLSCRLARKGGDVLDTNPGPVYVNEADFHYQIDTLGSRQEWAKDNA